MGPFEKGVLAAIHELKDEAWGSKLRSYLCELFERDVAIGQLYLSLSKLTEIGWVSFELMESESKRGGRAKKRFKLEAAGLQTLMLVTTANDAAALHSSESPNDTKRSAPAQAV